jgi:hypothetical protein
LENPRGCDTRKKCCRAVRAEERIVFHEVRRSAEPVCGL